MTVYTLEQVYPFDNGREIVNLYLTEEAALRKRKHLEVLYPEFRFFITEWKNVK